MPNSRSLAEASPSLTINTKGGDEIFVKFEPDAMAGVNVSTVDPTSIARECTAQRMSEPGVVLAEPGEDAAETVDDWDKGPVDVGEFLENSGVPVAIDVGVADQPATGTRPKLPVGTSSLESSVQRQEVAVDLTDHLSTSDAGELGSELTLILGTAQLGEGPTFEVTESGVRHPTASLRVVQLICRLGWAEFEATGNLASFGEPKDTDSMHGQQMTC